MSKKYETVSVGAYQLACVVSTCCGITIGLLLGYALL